VHDFEEVFARFDVAGRFAKMSFDVILDDHAQQTVDRAPAAGDLLHDLGAAGLRFKGPLDRFDLAADTAHAI
jgi:hypothetical protein